MALTHWAFFYTAPGAPSEGTVTVVTTASCKTVLVGVPKVEDALPIAKRLVDEGVQLVELCGGFGPLGTAKLLEATGRRVPVGAVGYGPESVDGVHALFS